MKKLRNILALSLVISAISVSAQTLESVPPSIVQDVTTESGENAITFTWAAATDEDGIIEDYKIYYGTSSVQTENDVYESEVQTGNVLSFTLSDLEPGTTYYAAITAIDDEGNESSNYSVEAVARTLEKVFSDGQAPQVVTASYVGENTIEIAMSESVKGATDPASLTVTDAVSGQYIDAVTVETNDTIIVATFNDGAIGEGNTYEITVSSIVTDLEGNPVSSGITDTVQFVALPVEQCEGPLQCFIEAVDAKKDALIEIDYTVNYFDKLEQRHTGTLINVAESFGTNAVQLVLDPTLLSGEEISVGLGAQNVCVYDNPETLKAFANEISLGATTGESLFSTFTRCDVYDEDGSFKETTQMGTEGLVLIEELVSLLSDVVEEPETNPFDEPEATNAAENNTASNPEDTYSSAPDTVAPLDVTSLDVDTDTLSDGFVTLSWVIASDIDEDIADQLVYTKKDGGQMDNGVSLGKDLQTYVLEVESDSDYEVVVVTVDASGNESFGRSITFSTEELVASGGSINVVLLGALAVGLIVLVGRRRA